MLQAVDNRIGKLNDTITSLVKHVKHLKDKQINATGTIALISGGESKSGSCLSAEDGRREGMRSLPGKLKTKIPHIVSFTGMKHWYNYGEAGARQRGYEACDGGS